MPSLLPLHFLLLAVTGWANRQQAEAIAYLVAENRILRSKLPKRVPLTNPERMRLAELGKRLGRKVLKELASIGTPDTILGWYRKHVAAKYDGSAERTPPVAKPGRRPKPQDLREWAARIARQNPTFGYGKIVGALKNVGHHVSESTVSRILRSLGIPPAPERSKQTRWRDYLRAQFGTIAAADFFSVEVLSWFGLVRFQVLFVIDLATRKATLVGVARDTDVCGDWVANKFRALTDPFDGFLRDHTVLILDRDPVYTKTARAVLKGAGVEPLRIPPRSPNLNAYAERFVGSVRRECLSRIVPLREAHLRRILEEYFSLYNSERNHQSLDNELIEPEPALQGGAGEIQCCERLGGLLRFYHRAAA